jgi:hypothetical protein
MTNAANDAPQPTIATQLLQSIETASAGQALPPVKALHLPPSPWNKERDGEFGAIELADGSLGLSYVLLNDTLAQLTGSKHNGLIGQNPVQIARWWLTEAGTQGTIGFAALNAVSRHLMDQRGFAPPDARDSIADLDPQPGDHIGMVGYFPPLIKRVAGSGARLTVLELKAALVGVDNGVTVTLDAAELSTCNKILSTSTVLLNHTIDGLLPHFSQAKRIALIGPGAGCLPDALFDNGIHTMGGTWITDGPGFVAALTAGRPWGNQYARKFTLHCDDYPSSAT